MADPKPPRDDDEWEDTPVAGIRPQLGRPSTQVGVIDPGGRATARKALAKIDELGKRFDDHAEMDRAQLDEIKDEQRRTTEKIDESMSTLSDLRVATATLTIEVRQMSHEQRNRAQVIALQLEREAQLKLAKDKAEVDDTADKKKFKRSLLVKLISVLGPIFAALGGALALLLRSCT